MIVKKRKGRNPLPVREKKKKITLSFYISPIEMDRYATRDMSGEEVIRQDISDYFNLKYSDQKDIEPPV
jgi:hypothetical protein